MTRRSRGLVRSCDKPKTLYLHCHTAYDHKTWQDDDLLRVTLPIKSHDHIITWSYKITWQTKIIKTMSMAINFDRVGIYNEVVPSINLQDPLITWSCKVK